MKRWDELRNGGPWSFSKTMNDLYKFFQETASQKYSQRGWVGMTLSQVLYLSQISENGTRLTDIADALGTTKQYTGRVAQELEKKGLIELLNVSNDRRVVLVKPTTKGRDFLEAACEVRTEIEKTFLEALGPDLTPSFFEAVQKLSSVTQNIKKSQS